jgi:hypothetical protein
MARMQVRSKVGVVTTMLGLAVLLAGPTATLGLGVPTVDSTTTQVTSTVQDAVQTTEQTATTTVTQVESTVQSTQQVAAPQPTASAPAPAPATPAKTVTTRVSAPVQKATTHVARPSAPATRAATTVAGATQRVSSARTTASKRTSAKRTHKLATRTATSRPQSRASDAPSSQCDVPLLALLPGGSELNALLAVACDAAGVLDLPARLGLAPAADAIPAPSAPGSVPSSAPMATSVRARAAGLGTHRATGAGGPAAAGAASAAQPGTVVAGIHAAAGGHEGALPYLQGTNAAHVAPASNDASPASASQPHHHTWFSGQSRGTEILMALIFASLSLLTGLALWRLAVRWVIPRFA